MGSLALCTLLLGACGTIPLPDSHPPLTEISLPAPGQPGEEVRRLLGTPDLHDTARDWIYEWTADRKLAFALITPIGIPYGDMISGQRFRLHVALDDTQRVAYIECSSDRSPEWKLREAGCIEPEASGLRIEPEETFELSRIAELKDVRLFHADGGGAPVLAALSPNGALLAIMDVKNTVWIIDLDARQTVGRFSGKLPGFWVDVPQPRVDFAPDGQHLLISQGDTATVLVRASGHYEPESVVTTPGAQLLQYGCCQSGLVGFGASGVFNLEPGQTPSFLATSRGRLRFGDNGAVVQQPAPAAPARIVELDSAALSPVVTALIASDVRQHRIMDTRFDLARARSPAHFVFSPDGRWLIRNACRYVEWWDVGLLTASLGRGGDRLLLPTHVAMLPLAGDAPRDMYTQILEGGNCFGPVAFDPQGALIAVASRSAVHVWRMGGADGTPFEGGSRSHRRLDGAAGGHVVDLAIDADRRLTAVTVGGRGEYRSLHWRIVDKGDGDR